MVLENYLRNLTLQKYLNTRSTGAIPKSTTPRDIAHCLPKVLPETMTEIKSDRRKAVGKQSAAKQYEEGQQHFSKS